MKTTMNMFEYAVRNKLRFASSRGDLTVEQLFDVPLRSKDEFNLDQIAKTASRTLKALTEESFVETERVASRRAETTLDVVKYVIASKIADEETAKQRAANKIEKARLLEILAEKQAGKLSDLSESELKRRIAALEE